MQNYLYKLEYNKIKEKISTYCATSLGKGLIDEMVPFYDKENVSLSLNQTFSAYNLLYRKGVPPIENVENIDLYIKSIESGSSLSAKALLEIAKILQVSFALKNYFYSDTSIDLSEFKSLEKYFTTLYYNKDIVDKIYNSIVDENTISDNASSKLSSLRRSRRNIEQTIKDKLNSFVHGSYSKYMMDALITIRNDRYVIPVKEEYKDVISGSILDVSASGSTVFIEPSSIFELNNKINNIKADEILEIDKILFNLSMLLIPIIENLKQNLYAISNLDFIFAKARYSKDTNGILPKINDDKFVNLINAKHPLISDNIVVPIDISIGTMYNTLVITGPNTGGKTVSLKTIGLLLSMAYSGIMIPANEKSSIYVFDNIFVDIGDDQSILESLSTFSSHMINLVYIMKKATSNSLIIVDELGSGTDPVEGASLAIAILDYFYNLNALTICTSHYQELKNYALLTNGFENACADFDVENLKPTYKLLIGIPGKSNAIAISKKLGLSDEIISRAKSLLDQDHIKIEDLLKNLYDDQIKLNDERKKQEELLSEIETLKISLQRDNSKLNEEADNIISNAKQKASKILLDAKEDVNYAIKEINKENISNKDANNVRNKLNKSIDNILDFSISSSDISLNNSKLIQKSDLHLGDIVFVKKFNQNGIVINIPDNKSNEIKVQIGSLETNINLNEVSFIKDKKNSAISNTNSNITFKNNLKTQNIPSEINVIGLNVDEAISIVDKYLDDASVARLECIRIVHGKGTGKLREGIQRFLKSHPHVKSYRIGTFGEGEMGVTVVELK